MSANSRKLRIAVGGLQHETNTFAAVQATLTDFEAADAWPGLTRGPALIGAVAGINLPAYGFIAEANWLGYEIVPLLWASATPSAQVTEHAYEQIVGMLLEDLDRAGPVDAIYLDLHGAMVCTHLDDGEGELLRRIRMQVGADLPLVASLDFHANVTELMVEQSSAMLCYRTYPHVDMEESGRRMAHLCHRVIERAGKPLGKALRKLPYLIPLGVCRTFQVFRALGVSATIGALLPRARPYEPFCPS